MTPTRENAETLAAQAVAWLLQDDELSGVFMGASGVSADDLRVRL